MSALADVIGRPPFYTHYQMLDNMICSIITMGQVGENLPLETTGNTVIDKLLTLPNECLFKYQNWAYKIKLLLCFNNVSSPGKL